MNVFKKVVLSGTPRERGVTYGRECAALIERTISDYTRYFDNKKNLSWSYVKEMAQKFIPAIEAFAPISARSICAALRKGQTVRLTKFLQ